MEAVFAIGGLIIGFAGVLVSPYIAHRLTIKRDKLQAGKQVLGDVEVIKGDIDVVKKDIKETGKRVGVIEGAMLIIQNAIIKLAPDKEDKVDNPGSPPQLTDYGLRLAEESGITAYIEQNLDRFKKEIGSYNKEVEVFEKAQRIANRELAVDAPEIQNIKSYFYQQAVDPLKMYRVYSLKLRDSILK